ILDRKKQQTIAAFQEIDHDRGTDLASMPLARVARLDVSSNQVSQADRLVVMVVDDLHIYSGRTDKAREIARNVLAQLGPQASMALLFTSGEHSTQVTNDQAALAAAVQTLKGRQSVRRPHPATDAQRHLPLDPEMSAGMMHRIISDAQDTRIQDFDDNMTQYNTLRDAARLLGAEGDLRRKAFVMISEGIGKDLSGIFGAMGDQRTPMTRDGPPPPPLYHEIALLESMESMRRANVAMYAIDPRGKVDSKDLSRECFPPPAGLGADLCAGGTPGVTDWASPVRQAQHGLEFMSEASGGFAVTNTDDFTSGLGRIVDDLDHFYLIGFYPSDSKGKDYRPIEVQIGGHPDWTLRYRHGYMPGGKPAPAKNADPLVDLSAGILPKADLPLRLNAVTMPGSQDLTRVALVLEVSAPRRDLQAADGKVHDTLKYEILLVDEKKAKVRSVGCLEGRVTLSPARPDEAAPETVAYQVTHVLDVKPGRYEFRVSALSAKLARGGSVYVDVEVPSFDTAAMTLGTLAIGYADGAHVAVAPTVIAGSGRGAQPTPVSASALPFPPSLDRVFASSDTMRVYAEGMARSTTGLMAVLDVVDANGKVVASQSPSFSTSDRIRVTGDIPLQDLAPGAYLLRVTLTGGGQKAVRESGFAVR
ncbi:MAG TPA: VWA domain-containing protein, partial [Vicinamibacterales bacterium]